MPSDRSPRSGRIIIFRFIRRLRLHPNRPRFLFPRSPHGAFGTLQYSVVYNNFPPPSPPPPWKRPRRPLCHHFSVDPLILVFPGNLVSLRFKALCRSSSAVLVPRGPYFRPPFVTSRRSVESCRRLRTHLWHPRWKPLQRNAPRIASWSHQNRSPRRRSFAPDGLFSHPLSWPQNSSRIGAVPIEPGRNFLVSALARLAGAKRPSATL